MARALYAVDWPFSKYERVSTYRLMATKTAILPNAKCQPLPEAGAQQTL